MNQLYHMLDPVAFAVGPFTVRWYGIAYALGFLAAAVVAFRTMKRWKLNFTLEALLMVLVCAMLGIIVGGRLGYVLFYGNGYYFAHPLEILAFNQGGMSFHGGLTGALLGGVVAARITHIPYLTLCDIFVIGAPIGLALGRCANFINGELWGAVTDWPIGVVFGGAAGTMPRHPSQLYEALLEGVVMFAVLYVLSRKVPPYPRGTFTAVFLVLYGVFRFLIEFVRQPDAQLGYLAGGWLTMGMVLSLPLIVVGIILLTHVKRRGAPEEGLLE